MANDDQTSGMQFTADEQAELDRLLEHGEALDKELEIHPIVRQVIHLCLEEDGVTWRKELPPDREAAIYAYLEHVRDTSMAELGKAVFDLIRLSVFLDHEKKLGMPAYQLFNIGNEAVIRFGLLQTVDTNVERDNPEQKAKAVAGTNESHTAPRVDDEKPEGAVSLDTVTPWRRI